MIWVPSSFAEALARRDREPSAIPTSDRDGEPIEAVPAFLPVRQADLGAASPHPSPPIEIALPTGPTVHPGHAGGS